MIKQLLRLCAFSWLTIFTACQPATNSGNNAATDTSGALPSPALPPATVQLPATAADTPLVSSLRKKELLKLHTPYQDTVHYVGYNDDGDDYLFAVRKGADTLDLIFNTGSRPDSLKQGDAIVIHWNLQVFSPAGDEDNIYVREFLQSWQLLNAGQ